jgi:hypothetical protein
MRTVEEVVEATRRELEESKNAKADPFTRRQCRPTLVTKVCTATWIVGWLAVCLWNCNDIQELAVPFRETMIIQILSGEYCRHFGWLFNLVN